MRSRTAAGGGRLRTAAWLAQPRARAPACAQTRAALDAVGAPSSCAFGAPSSCAHASSTATRRRARFGQREMCLANRAATLTTSSLQAMFRAAIRPLGTRVVLRTTCGATKQCSSVAMSPPATPPPEQRIENHVESAPRRQRHISPARLIEHVIPNTRCAKRKKTVTSVRAVELR